MTGLDMSRMKGGRRTRATSGYAYVGGACVRNVRLEKISSVALVEDSGGYSGVVVTAHELGHLLGAVHDGDAAPSYLRGPGAKACPWSAGYIMSDLRHTARGQAWSQCSAKQIRHFLATLTASCLYNAPASNSPGYSLPGPATLPGASISLDDQCGRDKGTRACYHDHRVCAQLFCYTPNYRSCYAYRPAVEGSKCGHGKMCINGKCSKVTSSYKPQLTTPSPETEVKLTTPSRKEKLSTTTYKSKFTTTPSYRVKLTTTSYKQKWTTSAYKVKLTTLSPKEQKLTTSFPPKRKLTTASSHKGKLTTHVTEDRAVEGGGVTDAPVVIATAAATATTAATLNTEPETNSSTSEKNGEDDNLEAKKSKLKNKLKKKSFITRMPKQHEDEETKISADCVDSFQVLGSLTCPQLFQRYAFHYCKSNRVIKKKCCISYHKFCVRPGLPR